MFIFWGVADLLRALIHEKPMTFTEKSVASFAYEVAADRFKRQIVLFRMCGDNGSLACDPLLTEKMTGARDKRCRSMRVGCEIMELQATMNDLPASGRETPCWHEPP